MLACEPLAGWRVIAEPTALDAVAWAPDSTPVRISPDDVFVIGGPAPQLSDPHAIVTPEHGFVGASLTAAQLDHLATHHIEWALPPALPALAQGQIAGVPAKLILHIDGSARLLVATAAHHELVDRVGGTPVNGGAV